jgi:hypothetical protein
MSPRHPKGPMSDQMRTAQADIGGELRKPPFLKRFETI